MAPAFRRYSKEAATRDTVLLRVVQRGERSYGFVDSIDFGNEDTPYYPTEELPMPEAIRLAENRNDTGGPVMVELEEDAEWNPEWGKLE
ncbi:hypothetical protein JET14_10545 [Martelella lutilitoris]|uniref:Uncharacterized protein n=1 Tax=Martelella lutilitoris TaxID=2583532 RepID=A0A7T7KJR8_9HYPH|nr:hypothetical protein [Martelella lutilitoris]QQM28803.1 hypothetical protein JET14_10545 [Martelella lutilitoris]